MTQTITRWLDDAVLWTGEAADRRDAVIQAVAAHANLQGADLRGAYLQGAYLRGAYLQNAYLQNANLRGACLQNADLRGAYLQDAYLQDADLQDAYFQDADLQDANLRGANLRGAYLQNAYLQNANLRGADLQDAYFQDADLQDADLRGANLRGADLRGAKDLRLPTGELLSEYFTDTLPALLTAGGKSLESFRAHWECHAWDNCPMHHAFDAVNEEACPVLLRPHVRQFVELYDARQIPWSVVQAAIDKRAGSSEGGA
jgi:hypothetical protein